MDTTILKTLLDRVPPVIRAQLDAKAPHSATSRVWAIVGGACRDTLLGVEPRDLDIIVWLRPEELEEAFPMHPIQNADREEGDRERDAEGDYTHVTVKAAGVDIWSRWEMPGPWPKMWNFDYTVNCIAVYSDGTVVCHPTAMEDLEARRLVPERGGLYTPGREAHMLAKGFTLCIPAADTVSLW